MCTHTLSPLAQTLHRNAANLLKEHGPFSHIRKASAVPPKPPKLRADGERPPNAKAPTERVLYTDDFGEEFEVDLPHGSPPTDHLPRITSHGSPPSDHLPRTDRACAVHVPCLVPCMCHACAMHVPCLR